MQIAPRALHLSAPVFALGLLTASASADGVLKLGGTYGDERGCRFQKTNDYGEEPMLSLTDEGFQTYVEACDFVSAVTTRNGEQLVTSICSSEGEGTKTVEFVRLVKIAGADSFEIYRQAGDMVGTASRCPP